MSIENFIKTVCVQTAVLWTGKQADGFGKHQFTEVREIPVRWDDKIKLVIDRDGKEVVSTAQLLVTEDIPLESMVKLTTLLELGGPTGEIDTVVTIGSEGNVRGFFNDDGVEVGSLTVDEINDTEILGLFTVRFSGLIYFRATDLFAGLENGTVVLEITIGATTYSLTKTDDSNCSGSAPVDPFSQAGEDVSVKVKLVTTANDPYAVGAIEVKTFTKIPMIKKTDQFVRTVYL